MSQQGILSDSTSPAVDIETLTGDVGGVVGPDGSFNINLLGGTGLTTVGTPASNQIVFNVVGGGVTWNTESSTTVSMSINNGYINTNAALTTFTLPATATIGDVIEICGEGSGGWKIAQNAGQTIQYGSIISTVGVAGSLNSTNRYDSVKLICRITNTTWHVLGNVGILSIL